MYFRIELADTTNVPPLVEHPLTGWIQTIEMEIEYKGEEDPLHERGMLEEDALHERGMLANPRRWGQLGLSFEYSPDSDLMRLVRDARRKSISVSTAYPIGEPFNIFENVFLKTFSYGRIDYYDDMIIAEATWLFENAIDIITFQDLETIIYNHSRAAQDDHISWQKYGF